MKKPNKGEQKITEEKRKRTQFSNPKQLFQTKLIE